MPIGSWPAPARHMILAVLTAGLSWGATDLVPSLQARGGVAAAVAVAIGGVLAVLTPLVDSYGVGAAPRPGLHRDVTR
jgi:hypothetical protein